MAAFAAPRVVKLPVDEELVKEILARSQAGETPRQIAETMSRRRPPRGKVPEGLIADIRDRLGRGERPQSVAVATGVGLSKVYQERRIMQALSAARPPSELQSRSRPVGK